MMLPADVSTEGWRIDRLLHITNVMVAVLAVVFVVWLGACIVRGVRARAPGPPISGKWQLIVPLGFAAIVLFVLDATLLVTSSFDLHGTFAQTSAAEKRDGAVRIEVSGQQWAWNIRYAGPDGRFATADDPVTINELVVPIGQPVVIELASSDVVHALHLPNVRIKRDAIPGRIGRLWFEANTLGQFDMLCAQFCGPAHYRMAGVLRVVSRQEFKQWIDASSADSLAIAKEEARSLEQEPSRRPFAGRWPSFVPEPVGRDWGWQWGGGSP